MAALAGPKAVDRKKAVVKLLVEHQLQVLWQGLEVVTGVPHTTNTIIVHCTCGMRDAV